MTRAAAASDQSDAEPTVFVTMETPPSTNALWSAAPGKKRVRSTAYTKWLYYAGWQVRIQLVGVPQITGTFRARIVVPAESRRDRDNWTKAVFDLLQHVGAIRNDSGLRDYAVCAADRSDVLVALWDLGGPEQREPRPMRTAGRQYRARPSVAQVRRSEAARRLPA